ncbi:MAG: FtsX-like permease family protein [Chloroflexi bacterium]|jgi:putative ABC transport system permease protein|nr:FtsX-like permease family protein [Chloroflexota bacterium]MBT7080199.1 FtsX-like permease family protein [Chloroflexota bacterium]MBT7290145.1 FtsX-like permease family protein [Chloroflexota bacterium]
MSIIKRSLRNVMRSPFRSMAILVILAMSIGLSLTMLTVNGASESELGSISGLVGTDIQVSPAGSFGPFGGGELDEADVDELLALENVNSIRKSISTSYMGGALESPLTGRGGGPGGGTRPIMAMGVSPEMDTIILFNGGTIDTTEAVQSGRYFEPGDSNADVMVMGDGLAEINSLSVGDTVDIEGVDVQIIGIYDTGSQLGDNMLVMPIETAQRVFSVDGVTSVIIVADDVSNVDGIVAGIREVFDEDTADVVTAEDRYENIDESLTNAINSSQIGMIVSFVVAGLIILFSVFLMMRQRIKEIGILKAIGASNWHIGLQFSVETLLISVVGAILGALMTFPLAQSVANMMTGTASAANERGGGKFGGGTIAGIDVAVSPEVFLYALGIAIALALVASIIPALYISRVRPAEVLRNE